MHIGLLGALEVLDDDGNEVSIAGAKLRALLAVLAVHVGRVVSAEHLVDALWGAQPPAAVRNGLQGLASKLRRALGSSDLVVMRGDGYALEVPPEAIDVGRFEQLAAEGRALAAAGELERAVDVLAEADSLWRGEPLAEFAYDDSRQRRSPGCPSHGSRCSKNGSTSSCSWDGTNEWSSSSRSLSPSIRCARGSAGC
jgi:DNA-binding SARP family transcriptional activator